MNINLAGLTAAIAPVVLTSNNLKTGATKAPATDDKSANKAETATKKTVEAENKASDGTTVQSKATEKKIIASNLESLNPTKPDANSKAKTPPTPKNIWEELIGKTSDLTNSTTSRMDKLLANPETLEKNLKSDPSTVAKNFGLSTPNQNSQQAQSGLSSQAGMNSALGGSPNNSGGGPGINNTVINNGMINNGAPSGFESLANSGPSNYSISPNMAAESPRPNSNNLSVSDAGISSSREMVQQNAGTSETIHAGTEKAQTIRPSEEKESSF